MLFPSVALNILVAFFFSQCRAEITINQVNHVPAIPREDVDLTGFRHFPALYKTEVVISSLHDEVREVQISSKLPCLRF